MKLNLMDKMKQLKLDTDQIAISWLGQAGFLLLDSSGVSVIIDPYLTDYCERTAGFKRLSPSVLIPKDVKADFYLASHNHPDHLDADAVPEIMSHPAVTLVGPDSVLSKCRKLGIDTSRLSRLNRGDDAEIKGIGIKAIFADHGELAPDAVGFLLTLGSHKIYFAGDTAYCPDKLIDAIKFKPDIAILPINGAYGNLNEVEAAKLTADTGAKISIPCHYWTFREHGGSPQNFYEAMKTYAPESKPLFLTPGEVHIAVK